MELDHLLVYRAEECLQAPAWVGLKQMVIIIVIITIITYVSGQTNLNFIMTK